MSCSQRLTGNLKCSFVLVYSHISENRMQISRPALRPCGRSGFQGPGEVLARTGIKIAPGIDRGSRDHATVKAAEGRVSLCV